ncbi:MAG TPA: sulfurtransferase TusA family protein [Clostridia bacterium]|nr:sulfurtransferase TusA family protein [Clostridia bacterium]
MKKIDCLGEFCPIPILKIKQELKTLQKGESFMLFTDHSCVLQSITDHYGKASGIRLEPEEVINGVWEITITKY